MGDLMENFDKLEKGIKDMYDALIKCKEGSQVPKEKKRISLYPLLYINRKDMLNLQRFHGYISKIDKKLKDKKLVGKIFEEYSLGKWNKLRETYMECSRTPRNRDWI